MLRSVLTILSALTLILCVAVVGLWVRSYWATDAVGRFWARGDERTRAEAEVHVASSGGMLFCKWRTQSFQHPTDIGSRDGTPQRGFYRVSASEDWDNRGSRPVL